MGKGVGDRHNFGRLVSYSDGWFNKPRSIFWERELLSESSDLRTLLNETLPKSINFCAALPNLEFKADNLAHTGSVSELQELAPVHELTVQETELLGGFVGFAFWLGISDLHAQNIRIGRSVDGRFTIAPIDVECIFENPISIQKTLLFPGEYISERDCGLLPVLPILKGKYNSLGVAFTRAFLRMVQFMNSNSNLLTQFINAPSLEQARIRILLRSTDKYSRRDFSQFTPFKSEAEQLNRGDIPYFFRRPFSRDVYYFNEDLSPILAEFDTRDLSHLSLLDEKSLFLNHRKTRSTILSLQFMAAYFTENESKAFDLNSYSQDSFFVELNTKHNELNYEFKDSNINSRAIAL